jgi:hypothetical protein
MTLDFQCNGRYLHLNSHFTSFNFHYHLLREVLTVCCLPKRIRSAVKAQEGRRMNAVIIQGAFTEMVRRLYRICTSFASRFYGVLQLQHR